MNLWPKVREDINRIVNDHFDTPEYKQFFAVRLTPARQDLLDLHYPHYIKSRRDCWAAASVKAPLDVKLAIWEHEKDELIYDKRMGSAHLTGRTDGGGHCRVEPIAGNSIPHLCVDVSGDDTAVDRKFNGEPHHRTKK